MIKDAQRDTPTLVKMKLQVLIANSLSDGINRLKLRTDQAFIIARKVVDDLDYSHLNITIEEKK